MFDFFICHSTKDLSRIEVIVKSLEENGLKVWVAPRDIRKGHKFPEEIIYGIKRSKKFLILFTENSIVSEPVKFETIIAFFEKKNIIVVNETSEKKGSFWDFYLQDAIIIELFGNNWKTILSELNKLSNV